MYKLQTAERRLDLGSPPVTVFPQIKCGYTAVRTRTGLKWCRPCLGHGPGNGQADAPVRLAGGFYCIIAVKKPAHLDGIKRRGAVGENNLSPGCHGNIQVAAAVFNGIAKNIGENPRQGILIKPAVQGCVRQVDHREDIPGLQGAVVGQDAFFQHLVKIHIFQRQVSLTAVRAE